MVGEVEKKEEEIEEGGEVMGGGGGGEVLIRGDGTPKATISGKIYLPVNM
ncbi:unnamed protein product [Ectocarpus sp. 12 AP-2014]